LRLYPSSFKQRFSHEMEEVFCQAASAGQLRFILREIVFLPASLAGAYLWAIRGSRERRMVLSSASGGSLGNDEPQPGWGDSLLAGLPHLIIGLLAGLPYLASALFRNLSLAGPLAYIWPFFILIPAILLVVAYGTIKGWGLWFASWKIYFLSAPVILISVLVQALSDSRVSSSVENMINMLQVILLPLLIAFLLYSITSRDRTAGLLASLPLMALLWVYFHEFVPELHKGLAWLWICGLAFVAAIAILRTRRYATALAFALAVPILGGIPNAFLGVYLGGTLPYSEPGPSVRVVISQYLPFLAMVTSLALGPLLARQVRKMGTSSAAAGGKRWYRLALGGILMALILVILMNVAVFSDSFTLQGRLLSGLNGLLIIAELLFVSGYALLLRAAILTGELWIDNSAAPRLVLLFLCLAGLPLIIMHIIPGTGRGLEAVDPFYIMPILSLAWIAASVWVVKE
jgi:hypothetical protein